MFLRKKLKILAKRMCLVVPLNGFDCTTPFMDRRLLKTEQALPNHASSLALPKKVQTL